MTFTLLAQFCQLVWFGVLLERERETGAWDSKMSRCGLSSFNLFSALTCGLAASDQKRRSITTPALNPNASARCRLADEHASASATASTPSAWASTWPPACCRQPSILERAVHLHDLHHLLQCRHTRSSSYVTWHCQALPSSVLTISASSRARHPSVCP